MRYDGSRTATVVGGWSEDGTLRLPVWPARSISTATPSSRRCCAAAARSAWTGTRTPVGRLAETVQRSGYRAAVAAPVTVGGRLWGALAAGTRSDEPLPDGVEQRLCDFAELVAQALANADAHEQLAASRARIVEVGDAERRRLERNLHDGAQQRLVLGRGRAHAWSARSSRRTRRPPARSWPPPRTSSPRGSTSCASWPAASIRRCSPTAVSVRRSRRWSRVRRCPSRSRSCPTSGWPTRSRRRRTTSSPRRSRTWPSTRTPPTSTVSVRRSNECATVTVTDDGVGGADPAGGSGLRGLADRVEALNGHLDVDSPAERGTRISAEIPEPRSPAPA